MRLLRRTAWIMATVVGLLGSPLAASAAPPAGRSGPVTVAVVDGGIDGSSPALRGTVDETLSRSFVAAPPALPSLHATLVAGLIAGNLSPVSARPIRLLDLRVRNADGVIPPRASARAIRYAATVGARVINLSYGSTVYSRTEASAVRYAVGRGALVVASAGNVGGPRVQWPARLPHVVAVGSVDASGLPSAFSNTDPLNLDLTAVGEGVLSSVPTRFSRSGLSTNASSASEDGFALDAGGGADGTSFSTAEVSAAAARLFALDPTLAASQVRSLLVRSADDLGPAGYDLRTGWGRLDLAGAEQLLASGGAGPADSHEPDDDTTLGAPRFRRRTLTSIRATASTDDDRADVRRFSLRAGDRVTIDLRQAAGPASVRPDLDLVAFSPTRLPVAGLSPKATGLVVGISTTRLVREHIVFTARKTGAYPIAVLAARGYATYWLRVRVAG